MARPLALRGTEAHAIAYKGTWRGSVFSTVLSPILFLAAMGLGLGSLVDEGSQPPGLDGLDYLTFLAPGLLAASAMQTAASEAMWPVMAGIRWQRTYYAMLATPLGAGDIAVGQLVWIAFRVAVTSVTFTIVMLVFGAVESAWVVLAVPAAVLTGMAHACPLAGFTASLENEYGLSNVMRFGVVPMFLFSGAFFPIEQLPDWIEPLAYVTPLWHGVALCRDLAIGQAELLPSLGHVVYMLAFVAAGTALARWRFEKRLVV